MAAELAVYTDTIRNTISLINEIKPYMEENEKHLVAQLYGIYYNAFAGAIRNGVMYKKEMADDGYQIITISVGNDLFSCNANVLRDILKEDFERLTLYPYDDTSASYVHVYVPEGNAVVLSRKGEQNTQEQKPEEARQNKTSGSEDAKRRKQQEEAIRKKNQELRKDARNFKYDPNYDHLYDDVLPDLVKSLSKVSVQTAERIAFIVLACCGIVLSLMFL